MNLISQQYTYVKDSREALLTFCDSLSEIQFKQPLDNFAGRSVHFLLVHIANVYIHWIGNYALDKNELFFNESEVKDTSDIRTSFFRVDLHIDLFIEKFQADWDHPLSKTLDSRKPPVQATALAVFTHVITHEYHHKGQILAMTRALGIIPPDTDIIRF